MQREAGQGCLRCPARASHRTPACRRTWGDPRRIEFEKNASYEGKDCGALHKKEKRLTINKIVDALEDELLALDNTVEPTKNPSAYCRLLLHLTLLLHALATNLHQELIERHALDSRWTNLRAGFLKRQGVAKAGVTWPY